MTEQITVTLGCRVDNGWRFRLLQRAVPFIQWIPTKLHERIIDWAVKGVKVDTFTR